MSLSPDNAVMWEACKEKEGREKGRTGAGAVKRGRNPIRVIEKSGPGPGLRPGGP